jgi:hypothetical protein
MFPRKVQLVLGIESEITLQKLYFSYVAIEYRKFKPFETIEDE